MGLSREKFQRLLSLYQARDFESATNAINASLRAHPKDPNVLHLAAQVAEAQGDGNRAVMYYRRALDAHPDWIEAEFNLATTLHAQNQHAEAIGLMSKVIAARPDIPQAQESLARFHQAAGDLPSATEQWEKALERYPHQHEWRAQLLLLRRQLCDWKFPPDEVESLPPQAVTVLADDPAIQKAAAMRHAKKFGNVKPLAPPVWSTHERLRVGYLSSDFHAHATAYLMAELFELHDNARHEIFAYSYGVDDNSAIRTRLKNGVEHFIELNNLTAQGAAERIRRDEIDILVDLKGYTRGSRLEILAYRPARVQAHWLGYPGTTGADFIDYFVGDGVTVPEDNEQYFTERVVRLPHCYQINDRQRVIAQTLPREAYGLPDNALVLASFNQTYKITPDIFALWCDILRETPESVLWLYKSNPYAPDYLRHAAGQNGIDPNRFIFAPPAPPDQHLARYAHVAFALDTFPVGGHTTTSDALWSGTPVITMMGKSFVSRVAASILSAADLSHLICTTPGIYKERALKLIRDKAALANLKQRLQNKRMSLPLFDTPRFVRDWEELLVRMTV